MGSNLVWLVLKDYWIERFSEVLNVQHPYSIVHLNDIFPCEIYLWIDYTAEMKFFKCMVWPFQQYILIFSKYMGGGFLLKQTNLISDCGAS